MSTDDGIRDFFDSNNTSLLFDACSFALSPDSWARMFGSGLSSWANTSPAEPLVALQWFYPFNSGVDGVATPGDEQFKKIMFVRQDVDGILHPCTVRVHNLTGAAVIETIHEQLAHLEPGFMVPLPRFVCISLDWLFAGWYARNEKAIVEENSVFVDEDGLFTEDEERELLRSLTMSRSTYARSVRLTTCTKCMEICGRTVNSVDVQQEGAADPLSDSKTGSEPVRVGTGGASVASVGSEAGKLHRTALARVNSTVNLTAGTPQVMD